MQTAMTINISILGPLEATRNGRTLELGPPQQRALLALLAVDTGRVVAVDAIIDGLWPRDPPRSAGKVVQTYVSRLRRTLGEQVIERRGRGYLLSASHASVDAVRFEALAGGGQLTKALELWRGPALADVVGPPALRHEAERLEELRLRALEEHFDDQIAAGNNAAIVAELSALVGEHPLRERMVGQLMVALYGAGRQAEALDVYRRARAKLVDELGIEPSPHLKELERRILGQDPKLVPARRSTEMRIAAQRPSGAKGRSRRFVYVGAAAATVVVACVAAAISLAGQDRKPLVIQPNSIIRIDPKTNEVVESIPVGREPSGIAATSDAVWVASERDRTLTRVDTRTGEVRTIGGLRPVSFLARDERGNVYASGWDYPFVWRIDPKRIEIDKRFRVRSRALGLAVGGGSLWVVDRLVNAVTRIDLARGTVAGVVRVGLDPLVAAFGYGALWVANSDDGTVSVIRAGVPKVDTVAVSSKPFGIAAGEGGVWVGSNTFSTVTRIDPDTRRVVAEIPVGTSRALPSGLYSVAAGAGAVWAANSAELSVVRIDPRTNKVTARIGLPVSPRAIAIAGDTVWVSVAKPGAGL
jgi:YVTN family beta-propeller protein